MDIFMLETKISTHKSWSNSDCYDYLIVRAEDGIAARKIAARECAKAVQKTTKYQNTLPESPWEDSDIVSCKKIDNHSYQKDGGSAILEWGNKINT